MRPPRLMISLLILTVLAGCSRAPKARVEAAPRAETGAIYAAAHAARTQTGALYAAASRLAASNSPVAPHRTSPTGARGYFTTEATGSVTTAADPTYTLDAGDKLRIVVYGQEGLTNSYIVGPAGSITMPLVGTVHARGQTVGQLSSTVADKLRQGYVREPHVAAEIESYRPFFILGEVNAPGQYAYVPSMTVETAVAIAGGFSPRASRGNVTITRSLSGQAARGPAPFTATVRPGDTITVQERWF
jgi:polysaccharide export outer membrane protein